MTGTLLVAHEHMTNRRFEDRIVGGKDRSAGNAEDDVDPGRLQRFDE
jgi:hypothetical protein